MTLVLSLILSCILSYISVGLYRSYAIKKSILDHPNHRSSHSMPTPRGGGVVFPVLWGVFLVVSYFIGFIDGSYLLLFLPVTFIISLVSFLDDKYQVAARFRFFVQLGVAIYSLFIMGGFPEFNLGLLTINWGWFGSVFICIVLLWSINLYNFMDGIDGIAAIEALFVLGVGGYFVWDAGGHDLAMVVWSMAAIVCGFLLWNKPPAKIFMGDVGSTLLGFLVVLFAIIGERKYNVPALLWVILYGVFWFDATLTLIRRFIHGDKWYQAHRLHAYQRLQLQNWSHSKIIMGVAIVNIVLAVLANFAYNFPQYMLLALLGGGVILAIGYMVVEKTQPMYLR